MTHFPSIDAALVEKLLRAQRYDTWRKCDYLPGHINRAAMAEGIHSQVADAYPLSPNPPDRAICPRAA